jgi:allantoate deiminase
VAERISIDPGRVEQYIMELAKFGAYGETGVWRTVYSPEWAQAQEQVSAWCHEAGLDTRMDAVGNVWGRLEGSLGGKAIVSGSHIDSQRPGGRYDGVLGVVSALVAVRTLREQFGQPKRPLEVLSFCEEESSRFPAANFLGSRAITGAITPEDAEQMIGYDGGTTSTPSSSCTSSRGRSSSRSGCRSGSSTRSTASATTSSSCKDARTTRARGRWTRGATRWPAPPRSRSA